MRDAGHDAVVVGSGPNGLAAAITLARAGRSVVVYEAATTWGGGLRTEELTLPGFRHDVCATAFPLAAASPFFRQLSLEDYGLSWVHPDAPLAHPLDDGTAVVLERSVAATAAGLGSDGAAWERIFGALSARAEMLAHDLLGPLRVPRHPVALARFGVLGLLPARTLARTVFSGEACPCPVRRAGRTLDACAGPAGQRGDRSSARDVRSRRRLAVRPRWCAGAGRCPRRMPAGGRR